MLITPGRDTSLARAQQALKNGQACAGSWKQTASVGNLSLIVISASGGSTNFLYIDSLLIKPSIAADINMSWTATPPGTSGSAIYKRDSTGADTFCTIGGANPAAQAGTVQVVFYSVPTSGLFLSDGLIILPTSGNLLIWSPTVNIDLSATMMGIFAPSI